MSAKPTDYGRSYPEDCGMLLVPLGPHDLCDLFELEVSVTDDRTIWHRAMSTHRDLLENQTLHLLDMATIPFSKE